MPVFSDSLRTRLLAQLKANKVHALGESKARYVPSKSRYWGRFRADFSSVDRRLAAITLTAVKGVLQRKPQVRMLDLGCGGGEFLEGIKKKFKDRIHTTGWTLVKLPEEPYKGVDEIVEGDFLSKQHVGKYDVVFSQFGAVHHAESPVVKVFALGRILKSLEKGGVAVVHISRATSKLREEIKGGIKTDLLPFLKGQNVGWYFYYEEPIRSSSSPETNRKPIMVKDLYVIFSRK